MTKVTDAIETIVRENLLYSIIVYSGLGNYTSIAKKMKKQVEFLSGKEVKLNTIVKNLTRLESTVREPPNIEFLKKSTLSVEYKYTKQSYSSFDQIPRDVLLVVKEREMYNTIAQSKDKNDLALIKILLPEEASGTPGLTLLLTEYLSIYGIQTRNIYRLDTEIWITVDIQDGGIVTEKLGKLLYNSEM